ncbi:lysozyme C-like [Xyrichtys novacula]|uniref:lysozyme n=1 Tax=Xyrichtys novacula TaxID=13765 RepID=A0AAV1GD51_XYRNO|nr:lysozyme C-like [Xyrichtys novacula]
MQQMIIRSSRESRMRGLVFVLLVAVASAKKFWQCEWAQVLRDHGMDGFNGVSLANWLCLTWEESKYDTSANPTNRDGSSDYGIFQINSYYWCDDGTDSHNDCGVRCSDLLSDDVTAAINCAKLIVRRQGLRAWYGWTDRCANRDLSRFSGC